MMQSSSKRKTKEAPNGKTYLNLGCGARVHKDWNHVDFSHYAFLKNHMVMAKMLRKAGLISDLRWERLCGMTSDVLRHDLRRGIPWEEHRFDFVYHSHFLEHLHRSDAQTFLLDCYRVLKPNGIIRVVVPDLHKSIVKYNESWEKLRAGDLSALEMHQHAIEGMYGQMVRTEATGVKEQKNKIALFLEKKFRSNPDKTGELHKWMYNEYTLKKVMEQAGFKDVQKKSEVTSFDPDWVDFKLDVN